MVVVDTENFLNTFFKNLFNTLYEQFIFNSVEPLFWLYKSKTRKRDGHCPLYLRLTINGERATQSGTSTKIYVLPENFDTKNQIVKQDDPDHTKKNVSLGNLKDQVEKLTEFLEKEQKRVTAQEFLKMLVNKSYVKEAPKPPKIPTIKDLWEDFLAHERLTISIKNVMKNHFENVILKCIDDDKPAQDYKRKDFDKMITDYLATPPTKKEKHENQRQNYFANAIASLKRVFEWSAENELIPINNCKITSITKDHPAPTFLTPEELEEIKNVDFSKKEKKNKTIDKLEITRQIFLFCCYTGLYACDYQNLVKGEKIHITEIQENEKTIFWVKGQRQKGTGKKKYGYFELPLFGYALEMWKRLNGNLPPLHGSYKSYVKKMQTHTTIKVDFSPKLARYTFAYMCLNEKNISETTISAMIGHTDTKMLRKYARVSNKKIMNDTAHLH